MTDAINELITTIEHGDDPITDVVMMARQQQQRQMHVLRRVLDLEMSVLPLLNGRAERIMREAIGEVHVVVGHQPPR